MGAFQLSDIEQRIFFRLTAYFVTLCVFLAGDLPIYIMEKSHDMGAVLSKLNVPPADIDRSIVSIARAQRASVRTNCACLDSRVDAACGSGNADQSAVSVPSELVSPLAAPFAGSCGLSPWICCTENTLVREYYRSRDSIRSYTRTTLFCPSTSTISLPHRRYS